MKIIPYLKDKTLSIILFFFTILMIILMLFAFKLPTSLVVAVTSIITINYIIMIIFDFLRKKAFYDKFLSNINQLDKKYLVLETIKTPNFYEGEIVYQALYDINKSMTENVKEYEYSINDFKEYIEMWIHEVKIPISSLLLMAHNHKDKFDHKSINQIKKLDNYIEQVLYYVRSENAEKDYLIMKCKLDKIISNVAIKNKDDLLENKIELNVDVDNTTVLTDSKWLEFILNQIINNSIKYKKESDAIIKISAEETKDKIILSIMDNGIGIPESDIAKVFQKSFTGHNGRIKTKSTGMGLYIAKKLCDKLGHKIEIQSIQNESTNLLITFSKNNYFEVLK